jgi:hypothetical protein
VGWSRRTSDPSVCVLETPLISRVTQNGWGSTISNRSKISRGLTLVLPAKLLAVRPTDPSGMVPTFMVSSACQVSGSGCPDGHTRARIRSPVSLPLIQNWSFAEYVYGKVTDEPT